MSMPFEKLIQDAASETELVEALARAGKTDAWEIMTALTETQFPGLDILNRIPDAAKEFDGVPAVRKRGLGPILALPWTIRHYAPAPKNRPGDKPDFTTTLSAFSLVSKGITLQHTNLADWKKVGNIGFTFYIISIGGEVPHRKWLGDCAWYGEWNIDEIDECWVSGDLLGGLNTANSTADASKVFADRNTRHGIYRGSGTAVKQALALQLAQTASGKDAKGMVDALDSVVGDTLELKVPHSLEIADWLPK
ncbi:hypothetical protein ABGB14_14015 [Nonomuraea sp. B10E15]|uniref:hypothetical protein n=1 Tax=Nonomuraea sp. B10E15 TaxID=3153560 RepID=UPI00325F060F